MNIPQQALHATPPESFTSPPLTPPPTDEKTTYLISRIAEKIKSRKDGRSPFIEPWTGYTIEETEYKDLLQLLRSDESLWGFTRHKLRYESAGTAGMCMVG
jgi:hypothetical protein